LEISQIWSKKSLRPLKFWAVLDSSLYKYKNWASVLHMVLLPNEVVLEEMQWSRYWDNKNCCHEVEEKK
jgi:hypothetical protein